MSRIFGQAQGSVPTWVDGVIGRGRLFILYPDLLWLFHQTV